MINFKQFKEHVVIPTLKGLDSEIPFSDEAVDLLMMTCAHESKGGTYLRQVGMTRSMGAFGVYQMELATHKDIHYNFLISRRGLRDLVSANISHEFDADVDLITNLAYATTMARVHYWRVPEPLPSKDDTKYLDKLGNYAKKYYNTPQGKATGRKYVSDYFRWIDGL
jgi:hypothetical protein